MADGVRQCKRPGWDTYRWRHLIEKFFGKLKEFRGIATRYCKTDESFTALISIAATVIRLT